jgi:misacylated tRNA(Ala) deacylase
LTELVFRDEPYLTACEARIVAIGDGAVELDRTLFYPAGGGQPGDTGRIGGFRVLDTRKGESADTVLHFMEPGFELQADCFVRTAIDWNRRHLHMRYHTALHLLCAVVQAPVTGGRIGADKAHLDFDVDMGRLQKDHVESALQALVAAACETRARWVTDAELEARPELVKTMSVAPPRGEGRVRLIEIPGIDLQACGGTHVRSTAEIGTVQVTRIRSEGKRNKRITLVLS